MWIVAFSLLISSPEVSTYPISEVVFSSSSQKSEELRQIDLEIEDLKEKKRGFEGRALRAEDQADRLQFEDDHVLETRRYIKIAEENRRKAQLTQEEIDRLEIKRKKFLGS